MQIAFVPRHLSGGMFDRGLQVGGAEDLPLKENRPFDDTHFGSPVGGLGSPVDGLRARLPSVVSWSFNSSICACMRLTGSDAIIAASILALTSLFTCFATFSSIA